MRSITNTEAFQSTCLPRFTFVALALGTAVVGLWLFRGGMAFTPRARDVIGDALWAMMMSWWVGAATPRVTLINRSACALAICITVELSQLIHAPSLDGVRQTTIGHLTLGSAFDPRDLLAYVAGVAAAAVLESMWRLRHR